MVIFALALTAMVAYFILNREKYSWYESYNTATREPYDLSLFYRLIDQATIGDMQTNDEPISESLASKDSVNYFFVSYRLYLDSASAHELVGFVEKGNSAFIAAGSVDQNLTNLLRERGHKIYQLRYMDADSVKVHLTGNKEVYPYNYRYKDKFGTRQWSVESDTGYYDDTKYRTDLGYQEIYGNYYNNFFSIKIGEGHLFFHTDPFLFTNYFLSKPEGFDYASKVLRHLPARPVIWETFHTDYHGDYGDQQMLNGESPLKYILAQRGLQTAWYLLLAGVLVFLLFRTKRQQRIIPLMQRVENTSIEFAKSLGTLYHKAQSGGSLAREMMRLFDNFNRRHYGINRKPKEGDFSEIISKKSKVKLELVQEILELQHKIIYNPNSRVREIVPLYHLLQEYYKNARK